MQIKAAIEERRLQSLRYREVLLEWQTRAIGTFLRFTTWSNEQSDALGKVVASMSLSSSEDEEEKSQFPPGLDFDPENPPMPSHVPTLGSGGMMNTLKGLTTPGGKVPK